MADNTSINQGDGAGDSPERVSPFVESVSWSAPQEMPAPGGDTSIDQTFGAAHEIFDGGFMNTANWNVSDSQKFGLQQTIGPERWASSSAKLRDSFKELALPASV